MILPLEQRKHASSRCLGKGERDPKAGDNRNFECITESRPRTKL